jgi:hypothetical protein
LRIKPSGIDVSIFAGRDAISFREIDMKNRLLRHFGQPGNFWRYALAQDDGFHTNYLRDVDFERTHDATNERDAARPADQNLRAVQLLLGHTTLESTVRYRDLAVDDALEIAEQTEV